MSNCRHLPDSLAVIWFIVLTLLIFKCNGVTLW